MPQLGRYLHKSKTKEHYYYWCPGCGNAHMFVCEKPHNWHFDGDIESPTFTPSMRVFAPACKDSPEETLCHHFVTRGQIVFLSDSVHELSGQTVPMVPVDEHADYVWGDS